MGEAYIYLALKQRISILRLKLLWLELSNLVPLLLGQYFEKVYLKKFVQKLVFNSVFQQKGFLALCCDY